MRNAKSHYTKLTPLVGILKIHTNMQNIIGYLYYRFAVAYSYIGKDGFREIAALAILLTINTITIYHLFSERKTSYIFPCMTFIVYNILLLPYCFFQKRKKAFAKFENESKEARLIGNICVVFYVIISIVSFVLIMKHYY
jgi:hypothetical protein